VRLISAHTRREEIDELLLEFKANKPKSILAEPMIETVPADQPIITTDSHGYHAWRDDDGNWCERVW
jgi:hypothetical protein